MRDRLNIHARSVQPGDVLHDRNGDIKVTSVEPTTCAEARATGSLGWDRYVLIKGRNSELSMHRDTPVTVSRQLTPLRPWVAVTADLDPDQTHLSAHQLAEYLAAAAIAEALRQGTAEALLALAQQHVDAAAREGVIGAKELRDRIDSHLSHHYED